MKISSLTAMIGLGLALAATRLAAPMAAREQDKGEHTDRASIERASSPATVLQHEKLGNYIEDIDFVPNGPLANHIVMMAGYEVYGLPAHARSDRAVRKLFDLRRLGVQSSPKGIAYLPRERLFAVVDAGQPATLFICDGNGRPLAPRTIQYLDGYLPFQIEGLAHIPEGAARFPNHLAMVVTADFVDFRVEVMRPDGQVVAEIPIPEPVFASFGYVAGVTVAMPDHLVLGTANEIWTIDFSGNIVSGPALTNTDGGRVVIHEGLTQLRDRRIVASNGAQLLFFDAALNRLPQDDRDAGTGAHLVFPGSVSWNTDTRRHLIIASKEEDDAAIGTTHVAALSPSLDRARSLIEFPDLNTFRRVQGVAYLPDEHLIAVGRARRGANPAEIVLYDNAGVLVEHINTTAVGSPMLLGFIRSTGEFVVRVPAEPSKLKLLTRAGVLAGEIDLSPLVNFVGAAAYFNPLHSSGGQWLIVGSPFFGDGTRAIVTDFSGSPMSEFDYRDALGLLGVDGLSAITTGPQAGAFSAADAFGAEIAVFRLRRPGIDD